MKINVSIIISYKNLTLKQIETLAEILAPNAYEVWEGTNGVILDITIQSYAGFKILDIFQKCNLLKYSIIGGVPWSK